MRKGKKNAEIKDKISEKRAQREKDECREKKQEFREERGEKGRERQSETVKDSLCVGRGRLVWREREREKSVCVSRER